MYGIAYTHGMIYINLKDDEAQKQPLANTKHPINKQNL